MNAELLKTFLCLAQTLQPSAPSDAGSESLEVRYARAQMQLAEANLTRVEHTNKRVARSVPTSVVAEYEDDVQVAKMRLQQAVAGSTANDFQVWLRRAEAEQRAAQTSWKISAAVNSQAAGDLQLTGR